MGTKTNILIVNRWFKFNTRCIRDHVFNDDEIMKKTDIVTVTVSNKNVKETFEPDFAELIPVVKNLKYVIFSINRDSKHDTGEEVSNTTANRIDINIVFMQNMNQQSQIRKQKPSKTEKRYRENEWLALLINKYILHKPICNCNEYASLGYGGCPTHCNTSFSNKT